MSHFGSPMAGARVRTEPAAPLAATVGTPSARRRTSDAHLMQHHAHQQQAQQHQQHVQQQHLQQHQQVQRKSSQVQPAQQQVVQSAQAQQPAPSAQEASEQQILLELQRVQASEAALAHELQNYHGANIELQDALSSIQQTQLSHLQGLVDGGDGSAAAAAAEAAAAVGQEAVAYAFEQVQVAELRAAGLAREAEAARAAAESAASFAAVKEEEMARCRSQVDVLQAQVLQFKEQARQQRESDATARKREEQAWASRAETAEKKAQRLTARVEELQRDLEDKTHAQSAESNQRITSLEKKVRERDQRIKTLEAETDQRIDALEKECNACKAEVEQEKGALLERVAAAEARASRVKEEFDLLQIKKVDKETLVAAEDRAQKAEAKLRRQEAETESVREAFRQKLALAEARAARSEEEKRALQQKVQDLQQRRATEATEAGAATPRAPAPVAKQQQQQQLAEADATQITTPRSSREPKGSSEIKEKELKEKEPKEKELKEKETKEAEVDGERAELAPLKRFDLDQSNLRGSKEARGKKMSSKEIQILQQRLAASALRAQKQTALTTGQKPAGNAANAFSSGGAASISGMAGGSTPLPGPPMRATQLGNVTPLSTVPATPSPPTPTAHTAHTPSMPAPSLKELGSAAYTVQACGKSPSQAALETLSTVGGLPLRRGSLNTNSSTSLVTQATPHGVTRTHMYVPAQQASARGTSPVHARSGALEYCS